VVVVVVGSLLGPHAVRPTSDENSTEKTRFAIMRWLLSWPRTPRKDRIPWAAPRGGIC
jgi:hypothetical protein